MLKDYRFQHMHLGTDNIRYIYDGEQYQRHFCPGGFLRKRPIFCFVLTPMGCPSSERCQKESYGQCILSSTSFLQSIGNLIYYYS